MKAQPISKAEAIARSSVEVENAVDKIVEIINKRLENFVEGSTIFVNMERLESGLSHEVWTKVKLKVIERYRAKGWKIAYNSGSQRDPCSQFDIS